MNLQVLRAAFAALLVVAAIMPAHADTSRHKVTMLLICDIYEMAENRSGRGGLARIATVLKQERDQESPCLSDSSFISTHSFGHSVAQMPQPLQCFRFAPLFLPSSTRMAPSGQKIQQRRQWLHFSKSVIGT